MEFLRQDRLGQRSYDVLLDDKIIAGLVRSGETCDATWTAELLADLAPWRRPVPFSEQEHAFGNLEEARTWLGDAEIRDTGAVG